ncbi:hypothetical protein K469DRAFT_748610 [Zopfia rhizophila CBS 207.26]|uniref:Uncharacterized protein n=1 Tax=Zopfia rhizophila CBS 207.26 TaxID=1314779 RepID=A0A6A6E8R4_9PEZI|nr:hypothetical protein K469DRAFT_748610 [Zopfia rhizophila CBS 207.26]
MAIPTAKKIVPAVPLVPIGTKKHLAPRDATPPSQEKCDELSPSIEQSVEPSPSPEKSVGLSPSSETSVHLITAPDDYVEPQSSSEKHVECQPSVEKPLKLLPSPKGSARLSPPLTSSLHGGAPAFKPGRSQHQVTLMVDANDFIPGQMNHGITPPFDLIKLSDEAEKNTECTDFDVAEKIAAKNCDIVTSIKAIVDGIHYTSDNQTFTLTCDTGVLHKSSQASIGVVAKVVARKKFPNNIQLNVLTGPRLQAIDKVVTWFRDTLGTLLAVVQDVQVSIIRCGEFISGRYLVPDIDFDNFYPIRDFIYKFVQVLPKDCKITWGGSHFHNLGLRKHYHSKAHPAVLEALADQDDKGVLAYSEAIKGDTLKKIASEFVAMKGMKLDAEYTYQQAGPSSCRYSYDHARRSYSQGSSSYSMVTNPYECGHGNGAYEPAVPFEPFHIQFAEIEYVEAGHHGGANLGYVPSYPTSCELQGVPPQQYSMPQFENTGHADYNTLIYATMLPHEEPKAARPPKKGGNRNHSGKEPNHGTQPKGSKSGGKNTSPRKGKGKAKQARGQNRAWMPLGAYPDAVWPTYAESMGFSSGFAYPDNGMGFLGRNWAPAMVGAAWGGNFLPEAQPMNW